MKSASIVLLFFEVVSCIEYSSATGYIYAVSIMCVMFNMYGILEYQRFEHIFPVERHLIHFHIL